MAYVPSSGAWQMDPEVRRLSQAYAASGRHTPQSRGDVASPDVLAFNRYISQNRQRLGIPEGYEPDPATGGQSLRKADDFGWDTIGKEAAIGGAMVAAPFAMGALAGGGGATLPNAAVPTSVGMNATPAAIASQGASAAVPLGGLSVAPVAATTAATAGTDALKKLLSVKGIAGLAPIIAALATKGNNGSAGIDTAALQRQQQISETQMRRADPLHQAVTQLAYQRMPVSARQGTSFNVLPLPQ